MTSDQVSPDPRWALIIGGLDAAGQPRPITYADLVRLTQKWPTTAATPPGVADLLRTARALITLAWFHYESMVVAGMWSLLAVEAALRVRLDSEQRLVKLIERAQREGLLTDQWATRLHAARQVRNDLAHARQQDAWTIGMAAPILATAHEVIAVLYPDWGSPLNGTCPGQRHGPADGSPDSQRRQMPWPAVRVRLRIRGR